MRKIVAYYRVSTKRQGRSGLGLAAQRRSVHHYCKAKGLEIIKEFIEVKSGRSGKRPFVHKAIKYCRQHDLMLIVATQSRLARSVSFISALTDSGFDFVSVDNPAANTLQKHIQAAFDQNTAEETSRNTKLSMQSAVKKGIKLGGNSKKRKKTIQRKQKAFLKRMRPIIRKLIKQEFTTVRQMRDELNRRRIRTYHNKTGGWHISSVHKLSQELKTKK